MGEGEKSVEDKRLTETDISCDKIMETRAAHTDELDCMLALMCEAFSLPFPAARELFYKDPYFDIERKRVLVDHGELISCLTVVHAPIWIGDAAIPIAGIAGVATKESERRKGYAEKLLLDTLAFLSQKGYGLTALFPFSYPYYRRFGWERSSTHYRVHQAPSVIPSYSESRYVRRMNHSDLIDAHQVYKAVHEHKSGSWIRDMRRWEYLFEHIKNKLIYKRNRMEGYLFFEPREENGRRILRLMEFSAISNEAARGMISSLAEERGYDEIQYVSSMEMIRNSGLISFSTENPTDSVSHVDILPGVMLRIVNILNCLELLKPNFQGFHGSLGFVMKDERLPKGIPKSALLEGDGTYLQVSPLRNNNDTMHKITMDVRIMAQIVGGYMSFEDALAAGKVRASTDAAATLASPLFPRREFLIPVSDYF